LRAGTWEQIKRSSVGNEGSGRFTSVLDEEHDGFVFCVKGMDDIDGKTGEGELVEDGSSMDILPKAIKPHLRFHLVNIK
jgi:hypothetical protein